MAYILYILPIFFLFFLKLIIRPHPIKIPTNSRHVFITGGSSGIGLAIARKAVAEGARVTILARDLNKLKEAKNSIRLTTGIDVNIVSADVRDYEAVTKAVESVGPIDVMVCNQGVFIAQEIVDQDMKNIRSMIDINLIGTVNLLKAALPGMKNRSDKKPVSIAFMSSQAGQVGIHGYAVYCATKFGLRGLAEALQQEVISDNIHVSLIFPPETYTLGVEEVLKTMPRLTSTLIATSGTMQADEVAKKTLNGIKSGSFLVSCNLSGFFLSLVTSGFSPQRSYLMAFVEVVLCVAGRIGALWVQRTWYGIIEKVDAQEK
ncbi:3-dehydrosphinganine reductase TSC10A-like [Bidens hawaiensis]|uniref:3-dehydrosphinganine reductase TSC10A-like n=1 Tax=Bidens hawaiensis TaxID=980011 RepID=UPI0040496EE0